METKKGIPRFFKIKENVHKKRRKKHVMDYYWEYNKLKG